MKTKEQNPIIEPTKEEKKSFSTILSEDKIVVSSMKDRNTETEKNETEVEAIRKRLKTKEEIDPIKRKAQRK